MRRHVRALIGNLFTSVVLVLVSLLNAGPVHAGTPPVAGAIRTEQRTAALPVSVDGGTWQSGHLQGMAIDHARGFMYFSFTDLLVRTDMSGNPIGSVTGFTGHLGDLDFNPDDGRVYGSLEYKDAPAFYIAIFDGESITRMNMDAQSTGVVSTVHLKEVTEDYTADLDHNGVFGGDTADTADHRYGCSGIDGIAFGPSMERKDRVKLTVAYGIYSHTGRTDNDHQVLLQYDVRSWRKYEKPLLESVPHTSGPVAPEGKFFVHTGNTTYGVQNLEYDAHSGNWIMAVYRGKKAAYPNYSLFVIDGSKAPSWSAVQGQARPEVGRLLSLLPQGLHDERTGQYGYRARGQYGLVSLDDGRFYIARAGTDGTGETSRQTGRAELYRWTGSTPDPFTPAAATPTEGSNGSG
ncbi:hypothetical protein ACFQ61_20205 [Streptomyces sp. NPDC056500]|uniref:hypothetical protein n=1 Tax=Streptomyces sp. NPDC056500 TaxID=3345840 RepID=UPI0036968F65